MDAPLCQRGVRVARCHGWRLFTPRRAGSGETGQGSTVLTWVDATQVVRFGSEKSPRV